MNKRAEFVICTITLLVISWVGFGMFNIYKSDKAWEHIESCYGKSECQ